jgi:MinD-like ATPase involved in chromosome partitioning or flagellar assembly
MEELQTCIHSHRSGLHYIPGHAREASSAGYPPGALAEVLSCLLTDYDVLVVDLGAAMTTSAGEALAQSAVIVPVTEHEGACVWHLRALLEGLERLHLRSKVPGVVLVDRSGSSTATPLSVVAEELGLDVLADIPPAADALHFANSCQQPLCLLRPENPASLVILQLSRRLTSIQVEQPTSSSL